MIYLNIVGPNYVSPEVGFIALLILIGALIIFRRALKRIRKQVNIPQDNPGETDVLGLEKQYITNRESYTTIGNIINWQTTLFIILILVGFYIISSQVPQEAKELNVNPYGETKIENSNKLDYKN